MKKVVLVAGLVLVLVFAMIGPAFAHFVSVETPSGQANCQFLGGPGNPGHAGHSHGHLQAIASEQSDAVTIGSC